MKKSRNKYHHGDLAESLLDAVDEIAGEFGLEAVTLRGSAKRVGVSPSSAFRHYADKRTLMTAFATRALKQLSEAMSVAYDEAVRAGTDAFHAVGMAYVTFALDKPAFFRAMWREESIYANNEDYMAAEQELTRHLKGGFADTLQDPDPHNLSSQELLAWSSVHGLASLFVDGSLSKSESRATKLEKAGKMIATLKPALEARADTLSP